MKKFLFSVYGIILMMLPLVITSCSEDDENIDVAKLLGKWELVSKVGIDDDGPYESHVPDIESFTIVISMDKEDNLLIDDIIYNLDGNVLTPDREQFGEISDDEQEEFEIFINEYTYTVKGVTDTTLKLFKRYMEDDYTYEDTYIFEKK